MTSEVVQSGFIEVQQGRLWYEQQGHGPALLLLHAGIADSRMWEPQIQPLAAHCRVVRYDLRGFGRSQSADCSFSNRRDLLAVLDQLEIERAALIGVSRGGNIVVDFTLEFPQRVAALIPVAAGVGGFEPGPADSNPIEDALFGQMDKLWEAHDFVALNELEMQAFVDGPGQPQDRVDPQLRAFVAEMNLQNFLRQDGQASPEPLDPPAIKRLHEIQAPTLVIAGELDTTGTLSMCTLLAQQIANARLLMLPGTAHLPSLEQPAAFNTAVREFLRSLRYIAA